VDQPLSPFAERPDRTAELRPVLIEAARSALELVGSPEVGREWARPSALEGMTVGGLAAHFIMALHRTVELLEAPAPTDARIATPFEFFGDNRREAGSALDDERGRWIAAASVDAAAEGQDEVVDELTGVIAQVDAALADAPTGTTIATARIPDARARLDDFVRTRLVEVVLHGDDLAASVGVVWHPPRAAADEVVGLLVEMARERVGDLEVLRGLAREERAAPGALRAL
jgi:uncharacterized protein (TIGR03083 family)